MMVRVVCLDDDKTFTSSLQTNINSLDSTFFQNYDTSITGIEVMTASEPEEAFKIINDKTKKITLLILDVELKYDKLGHMEYDELFYKGKPIPAIVVSAQVKTPERRAEITSKGISVIIDKLTVNLSEVIAEKICEVLGNPVRRILKLRTSVEMMHKQKNYVEVFNQSKPFEEWFRLIVTRQIPSGLSEEVLMQSLTDECLRIARLEGDHNRGFKRDF